MKRIIALCMTLCMLCPLIPVNAENTTAQSLCSDDVITLMQSIGVIDETFEAMAGNTVTKSVLADYVASVLKITDNKAAAAFADTQGFTGVNTLAAHGYIEGDTSANYNPQEKASFFDALKLMLKVLGYQTMLDYYEGDTSGLLSMAYDLDLIDGWDGNQNLTYGQMLTLLHNTIVLNPDDLNWGTNFLNTSILESVYGFAKIKGVVLANEYLSLYSDMRPATEGKIRIDDTVYDIAVDANDFIGKEVEAYIQTSDNGSKEIVSIEQCGDELCYELTGKALASVQNGMFTYYKNGESGSTTKVRLDNPLLIYNNYTDHSAGLRGIKELLLAAQTRQSADITVIKSENLSRDVIIVEMPDIVNVTSIDRAKELVYVTRLLDDKEFAIPMSPTNEAVKGFEEPTDYVTFVDAQNGLSVDITIIEPGDVLSVAAAETGSVMEVVRLTRRVMGAVTRTTRSGELSGAIINDTEYLIEYAYGLKADIRPNDAASFILDTYGNIAGAKGDVINGEPTFAYIYKIVGIYEQDDTVDVYLYNDKGEDLKMNFAQFVRLDGEKTSEGDVIDFLRSSSEQLAVIYKVNSEGKINFLDTPGPVVDDDDKLTRVGESGQTRSYTKAGNTIYDMGYRVFAATTEDKKLSADYNDGFFLRTDTEIIEYEKMVSGDRRFTNPATNDLLDGSSGYIELYKYDDETPFIEYAVIEKDQSRKFAGNVPPAMVNKFHYGISPEGEPCAYVEIINPGAAFLVYQVPLAGQIDLYINSCHMVINGMDIEKYVGPGDLVRTAGLSVDANQRYKATRSALGIEVIYDYSEDKLNYCWGITADSQRLYFDKEMESYDDYIKFLKSDEAKEQYKYTFESIDTNNGRSKGRYAMLEIYDYKPLTSVQYYWCTEIGGNTVVDRVLDSSTARDIYFDETRRNAPAYYSYNNDIKTTKATGNPDRIFTFRCGWDKGAYVYIYKTKSE